MKHSGGNWSIGITGGTVVTDNGEGFPSGTGHSEIKYYGGYLIAESINKKADAKLIAAAPDLLAACEEARRVIIYEIPIVSVRQDILDSLNSAIKKATE